MFLWLDPEVMSAFLFKSPRMPVDFRFRFNCVRVLKVEINSVFASTVTSCWTFNMDGKRKAPTRRLCDSGFGGSQRPDQVEEGASRQPYNYTNRPREESTQERLQFDVDTGKLVVSSNPEVKQEVVSVRHVPLSVREPARQVPAFVHDVREPVADRPVVDAMAAQGFFMY